MSISSGERKPRSCVDFAEVVCRFRQVIDWGTLEIGSDLENLRRGGELLERENIAKEVDMNCQVLSKIAREVDDKKAKGTAAGNSSSSRKSGRSVDRSGRPTCTACTGS